MKERNLQTMKTTSLAVGLLALTCAAAPVIRENSVSFAQDPSTRLVCVTYSLDEDPGIITFDVLTNGVSIGAANIKALAGDVNRLVQTGDRTIYWRPDLSWPGHKITDNSVTVAVTVSGVSVPFVGSVVFVIPDLIFCSTSSIL